jgi:hypothetical protein
MGALQAKPACEEDAVAGGEASTGVRPDSVYLMLMEASVGQV